MGEIIKIEADSLAVGLDDGSVVRVNLSDIDFIPEIGDRVKVYKDENGYLVSKLNEKENQNNMIGSRVMDGNGNGNATNVTNNYYNQGRPVNKLGYVLLAFFLGGIGAHKFYAGKTGAGIVYLIFCWTFIPGIIAFIEFIIGLTKPADEFGNIYL